MIDRLTDAQLAQRAYAVARMVIRANGKNRAVLDLTFRNLIAEQVCRELLRVQESSYSN